jgi:crooked neck
LEEDAYRSERDESEDGEGSGPGRVRETYERAVANVPPSSEKRWVAEATIGLLRRGS